MRFPISIREGKRKAGEMEFVRKGMRLVLEEKEQNGLVYLTFPALTKTGIVSHLFSTRMGGVSKGIFSTLNLSFTRGDEKEAVIENYRRVGAVLGCELKDFVCSDQTHTVNIRKVTKADCGKGVIHPKDYQDVDGLITDERGIVLSTFYADCVPLYFVDTKRRVIGLAHSGWRGTVGRIGAGMLRMMQEEYGCHLEDILAAVGPSICRDCYEVSEDVAEIFKREFGETVLSPGRAPGKYQLDLWKANELVLGQAGLSLGQITVTDICTCCNPALLFSHRASEGKRGNLGAFLMLKP